MDYSGFFGDDSPLSDSVAGFAPRPQQQAMAEAVGAALDQLETLVVEAGTGIGKSFAYLVPALHSGRRVLISTGTKTLQDQLYSRDLPTITQAIGRPVTVALLKGRSNYLCLHRANQVQQQGDGGRHFARIHEWSSYTSSGDRSELAAVPQEATIWPRVTSTVDNCLGSDCQFYDRCHVVAARRAAQEADVVIVNHHLLLADLSLKEEGFGELLPGFDACIIDEAHQLPEIAGQFFSNSVSTRQVANLVRDTVTELLNAGHSDAQLREPATAVNSAAADLLLKLGVDSGRRSLEPGESVKLESTLQVLVSKLTEFAQSLQPHSAASPGLEQCRERAVELGQRLELFSGEGEATQPSGLRWVEARQRSASLHLTPFDVAERLGEMLSKSVSACVLTSATLAIGDDFSHFMARIGLENARSLKLDSPFDFERNALLYIPKDLPDPGYPEYTRAVCEAAHKLIDAAGGGAFFLFTSHRALARAAEYFAADTAAAASHLVLVQGQAPRAALLQRFREHGHALLLGTSSFWEGVDVRGSALRLVIIDKLPFASPADPMMQARLESIKRNGGNPFRDYQLPQAVLALKQGVGRLIRDHDDRGVAMLCDPRIGLRSYGRVFLKSLPPMPVTDSEDIASNFFAEQQQLDQAQPL